MSFDFTDVDNDGTLMVCERDMKTLVVNHGLCVIPAMQTEKRPSLRNWKDYIERLPEVEEIEQWFAGKNISQPLTRWAVVCGKVSNNLECLDFDDGGSEFENWKEQISPYLFKRLVIERTPSGGYHCWYRLGDRIVESSKKIAKNESGKATIETRGEGALALCFPSPGYECIQGGWLDLPYLTADEHSEIMTAAESCNRLVEPVVIRQSQMPYSENESVIGKYNAETTLQDTLSVLQGIGWKVDSCTDGNIKLTRPGKDFGCSATLCQIDGQVKFKVFTTSDTLFPANEAGECYSSFDVYARARTGTAFYDVKSVVKDFCSDYLQRTGEDYIDTTPKVDLTGILELVNRNPKIIPQPLIQELPNELIELGKVGFINDCFEYLYANAYIDQKEFFLSCSYQLLSTLTAQMFQTQRNARANLYHVNIGSTGCGKDFPRTFIMSALEMCNLEHLYAENYSSDIGLQNDIVNTRLKIWLWDEMGVSQQRANNKNSPRQGIFDLLLMLYGKSNSKFTPSIKADCVDQKVRDKYKPVDSPYLNLMGSSTPNEWYDSLSEQFVTSGFIARICPFFEERKNPEYKGIQTEINPISGRLQETIERIGQSLVMVLSTETFAPEVVKETKSARDKLDEFGREVFEYIHSTDDELKIAPWSRTVLIAEKYALLHAIAKNWNEPFIKDDSMEFGIELSRALSKRKTVIAKNKVYESSWDRDASKILEFIKLHPEECTKKMVSNNFRKIKKTKRDEILDSLADSGLIYRDGNNFKII